MKGDEKTIELLNALLADELTVINQYIVHAEMCSNWDYERLHKSVEKRAIDEMKHAEKLIARVLFLEGIPIVSNLNKIQIGADVEKQLNNDRDAEQRAIMAYRAAIKACFDLGDHGTREILEHILEDEEDHIDHIEAQIDQVAHMGIGTYLSEQIEKE
ncbi:bacterioferritin [Candidatus Magnetominusculus dajiuhuensis]|uniref:bacterioferritin n=1 Tax=Candidatus Magnetominusculus dajiuhuensis TaxID=3137712 RepID=UPI003B43786F